MKCIHKKCANPINATVLGMHKKHIEQAFREFLVSPALIRNYKAVISISCHMFVVSLCCTSLYMIVADTIPYSIYSDGNFKRV